MRLRWRSDATDGAEVSREAFRVAASDPQEPGGASLWNAKLAANLQRVEAVTEVLQCAERESVTVHAAALALRWACATAHAVPQVEQVTPC